MSKYSQGDRVYSQDGEAAEYIAEIPNGHIVAPLIECCDGQDEEIYTDLGDPVTWRKVFAKAPLPVIDEQLEAMSKRVQEAQQRAWDAEENAGRIERECSARLMKLKKFDCLVNIENFIDGKITHYVKTEYYSPPAIVEYQKDAQQDNPREQKILTLQGVIGKQLEWKINRYADGSGASHTVWPCLSLEEAQEKCKEIIRAEFRSYHGRGPSESWMLAAEEYGIEVPADYRKKIVKGLLENLQCNIDGNRRQALQYAESVAKYESRIAELQKEIAGWEAAK